MSKMSAKLEENLDTYKYELLEVCKAFRNHKNADEAEEACKLMDAVIAKIEGK